MEVYVVCGGKEEPLKKLGQAYKNGYSVQALKQHCKGCFCVFIYDFQKERGLIFVDDYNLFNCYYSLDEKGNFIVTNTYWHIAKVLNKEMNLLKVYEYAHTYTILDNATPYNSIYRLEDDEYISLENNKIKIKKVSLFERCGDWREKTYQETLNALIDGIKENVSLVKNNFDKVSVCATGGMDSRVVVAALKDVGIKPRLVYWIGNSIMTGTEDSDKKIVKLISEKLGLEATFVDAPTEKVLSNEGKMQDYLLKLGELYHLFGCNSGIFEMYNDKNIVSEFHDFGVGINWVKACDMSALHLFEEVFSDAEVLSLDEVVEKMYIRPGAKETLPCYEAFTQMIKNEFMTVINREGFDENRLTKENVSVFSMEYLKRASSINYVLANNYVYSFPTSATKEMYRIIADTNYEYRRKNHIVVDCFLELSKKTELSNIPFYSDIKEMVLDKNNRIMSEPMKNILLKRFVNLKRFLIKGKAYERLRKLYHNLTNRKQGNEIDAINYWLFPMEEYLNNSKIYRQFGLKEPMKNLHFNQFIDLFFMIWATEHFDIE